MLHSTFHLKDFEQLTYFLELEMHHRPQGVFLNQHKYILDFVNLAGLTNIAPVDTPMEINVKYRKDKGRLPEDSTLYRKLVGSLIYLTITRPDISYVVHIVNKFMQAPRHLHLSTVRRILGHLVTAYSFQMVLHYAVVLIGPIKNLLQDSLPMDAVFVECTIWREFALCFIKVSQYEEDCMSMYLPENARFLCSLQQDPQIVYSWEIRKVLEVSLSMVVDKSFQQESTCIKNCFR